jgi:hypothetical protein
MQERDFSSFTETPLIGSSLEKINSGLDLKYQIMIISREECWFWVF